MITSLAVDKEKCCMSIGKVAVVTGGGGGIGRVIAKSLFAAGFSVLLVGRRLSVLEELARELREAGGAGTADVDVLSADVAEPDAGDAIAAAAVERLGGLDVLVTCAVAFEMWDFPDTTAARWDYVLNAGLRGTALCAAAAARVMNDRGVGGRMVFISSISADQSDPASAAYDASKGGVNSLTRALAVDLGPRGIAVNAIAPGWVRTPDTEKLMEAAGSDLKLDRLNPLRRLGEPEEIATVVRFLALASPMFLTGQVITVDGGQTIMETRIS